MKGFLRLLGIAALVGAVIVVVRAMRQYREDNVFDLGATNGSGGSSGSSGSFATTGERRTISGELLAILADPGDKGPVELMTDADGKEWLINRRNGYRYPVEDGIPIMLLEEGEKFKDESLIAS